LTHLKDPLGSFEKSRGISLGITGPQWHPTTAICEEFQCKMLSIFTVLRKMRNEMARVIVLTSEQWFLLSGTENTDGGLIL
jgi:hypothetical protein